ncbi:MAG: peptidylprolyl isomerase, partial [Calditrichaceae bacterium]
MYKIITKILLIVTVAVFSGCGLSDDTVAKVGDQKIKVDEFIGQLQKRFPGKENFSDIDSSAKMRVLNSMIEGKRKLAAAYDMGLDDNEKVKTSLENQEKSMIFSKYYESMVVDSVIDLNVVKESLDKMKDEVKASHILIKFKGMPGKPVDRTKEEAEKLAQSLAERVRNGESINTLAAEYSDDPSAAQNKGDLGYFTWGRMVDEFQKAAYNLKPGQVSEPVLTNYGYHVIQVEDRRPNPD